jgi:predicted DNA-binding transcriptional regulator AlpA
MVKKCTRPQAAAARLQISLASLYDKIANDPEFPKPYPLGEKAVAFDDDELLRWQLRQIAKREGILEAERATWVEDRFIEEKATAERVAEFRAKSERPTRRKRLVAA